MLKYQSICCHGIKTQEEFESKDSADMLHQKNRAKTVAMPEQADSVAKSPGNYVWQDNRD